MKRVIPVSAAVQAKPDFVKVIPVEPDENSYDPYIELVKLERAAIRFLLKPDTKFTVSDLERIIKLREDLVPL
jgi:hypothetical protein